MISQPLFEKLLFSTDCDLLRSPQLANAHRLKNSRRLSLNGTHILYTASQDWKRLKAANGRWPRRKHFLDLQEKLYMQTHSNHHSMHKPV